MKRLFSNGWVFVLVMLMATGAFADRKVAPNADCDVCLKNSPERNINWNVETVSTSSLRDEEAVYHDGSFEAEIGCGGGCAFSVRFTADTPIFLTGLTVFTQGGDATGAIVSIYADPASAIAGPPSAPVGPGDGTAIWESEPLDLSSPDGLTSFDIVLDNVVVETGDYYVVIWENASGYLYIANDLTANNLDRNWTYAGVAWSTINDAVAGDPELVGNFGLSATFMPQQIDGSYMTVDTRNINFGVLQLADGAVTQDVTIANIGLDPFDVTSITIAGLDFSTALVTPVTVLADSFVVFDVTLTPTVEGATAGTFTIAGTADNTTEIVVNASAMVFDGFPEYMVWNPSLSISGPAFIDAFAELGYTAVESPDLFLFGDPIDVNYSAIFICLGIFSDNYALQDSSAEVMALMAYADAGYPLYMEGGDTWAYDTQTLLHPYFGVAGFADGSGDLSVVIGQNLLSGMDYSYSGGNSFIDHLNPSTPDAQIIHMNPADSVGCGIGNLTPTMNSIGNSFEFGGLGDSIGTTTELLAEYLDFFDVQYTDVRAPVISGVSQFTFTLDTDGPYTIEAFIADNIEMDFAVLFYNSNGSPFSAASMNDIGDGVYSGNIPGHPIGSTVGYYIQAFDSEGNEGFSPEGSPEELYFFDVVSHLPPVYLAAISGLDGQIDLTWSVPGTEAPALLECADFPVTDLPFIATGSNAGMGDDFAVSGLQSEDVAYQLWMPEDGTIDITLCGSNTDYDTKLEIFSEDCITSTGFYDDDGSVCPESSALYNPSELFGVFLPAGIYLVVVDGFYSAVGNYDLTITESEAPALALRSAARHMSEEIEKITQSGLSISPDLLTYSPRETYSSTTELRDMRELMNYGIYRSETSPVIIEAGNQIDVVAMDPQMYTDFPLVNGTTYYYRVSAIYDDGEAASSQVEGVPMNHEPMMPTGLIGSVVENDIFLEWRANTDYDLAGYYVYRDGEYLATVTTPDTTYTENLIDGAYQYVVSSFDTGAMESETSDHIQLLVGEVPPSELRADGGFDDHIELTWRIPGNPAPPLMACADELIPSLPFVSNGSTVGMGDDFDVNLSDNEDYAYQLYMPEDGSVDITLCGPNIDYDSKLEIFNGDCDVILSTGIYDDDGPACDAAPGLIGPSEILGATLLEGVYFIVIDGFSDNQGNFDITVTETVTQRAFVRESTREMLKKQVLNNLMTPSEADAILANEEATPFEPVFIENAFAQSDLRDLRNLTHYNIYRDGSSIGTTVETIYNDAVEEDIAYFYQVTATYDNAEESAPTNLVEARANMAPGPLTNFGFEMNGLWNVGFSWVDPPVNMDWSPCIDLMGIMVKRNGESIAFVDPLEWSFVDNNIPAGVNDYEFIPFDEVPNYGEAIRVRVYGGEPPMEWDFEDGQLPPVWTQSNPIVPWMVGSAAELSSGAWTIPDNGGLVCAINDDAAPSTADGNNALITGVLDFSFSDNVHLEFDSFFNRDYSTIATVEYRIGLNGEWQVAETMTISEEWVRIDIDLSFLYGQSDVYLAFHHDDGASWAYGWAIDNILLSGYQVIMMGDMDGDGFLNILDVVRFIEIVTETGEPPTLDEMGRMDFNGDGNYNILDVVILIESVLNMDGLAKGNPIVEDVTVTVPPVTLNNTREWQNIPVTVDCYEMVSGFQADLVFDASIVELGIPVLAEGNESVGIFTSLNGNTMRVLAIDLNGNMIDLASGLLMNVPVQVIDENATGSMDFAVEDLIISGPGGVEISAQCLVNVIDIGLPAPTEFSLQQNYPNPFNPTTNIRYDIAASGAAQLMIYNMLGQEVRSLVNGDQNIGRYEVEWNGLDNSGQPVATGIYIYHLQAGEYSKTIKMAYIK